MIANDQVLGLTGAEIPDHRWAERLDETHLRGERRRGGVSRHTAWARALHVLGTATGLPYSARAFTNEWYLNPAWLGGLAGVLYREAV
jgi:hypothetical protein